MPPITRIPEAVVVLEALLLLVEEVVESKEREQMGIGRKNNWARV